MLKRFPICLPSVAGIALFGLICHSLCGAVVQPIAANLAPDRFRSLSFDNQRLVGILANRLRANSEGFLERIDYRQLAAAYDREQDKTDPPTADSSSAPGVFLCASANTYEYRADSELRKLMDQVADLLETAQQPDGYLGVLPAQQRGTDADYLAQASNLRGLLAYYRVTGEERAYTASQKIGDRLVKIIPPLLKLPKANSDGDASSLAIGSLIQPLVELHRYTADPDYLELAKSIAKATTLPSVLEPVPDLLAVLTGLADLFRLTGDEAYLRLVARSWQTLAHDGTNLTGVPSTDATKSISSCLTAAWMKLTLELFRITGQVIYGDQLEATVYNQLLAAQDPRNGDVCAETPLNGKKRFLGRGAKDVSVCALAEAEGLSALPQAVWARWGNGIAINFYSAGRGTFQLRRRALVQVYVEGAYPERGEMLIHVEPSHAVRFPLRLRIPQWASSFAVDFGGSHLMGKPGEFLLIDREWKRGDTVKISLSMRVQVRSETGAARVAVQRGPQILVLSRVLTPQVKNPSNLLLPSLASPLQLQAAENKLPSYWSGDQAYLLKAEYENKTVDLTLVPYADALDFVFWLPVPKSTGSAQVFLQSNSVFGQ